MSSKKILIVEDDQMLASMYETKLKQTGWDVIKAEDGAQGLDLALKEKPDLVLLDIILPQLDGFAVLREIRSKNEMKNTPIIMLTNLGTSDDKDKGKEMGATDYLVKAKNTPTQVCQAVQKYLK